MTKSEQSIYDLLCKSAPNRFITDEQETEARMIHAGLLRLGWRPPVPRNEPDPGPARRYLSGVPRVGPGESSGR